MFESMARDFLMIDVLKRYLLALFFVSFIKSFFHIRLFSLSFEISHVFRPFINLISIVSNNHCFVKFFFSSSSGY